MGDTIIIPQDEQQYNFIPGSRVNTLLLNNMLINVPDRCLDFYFISKKVKWHFTMQKLTLTILILH